MSTPEPIKLKQSITAPTVSNTNAGACDPPNTPTAVEVVYPEDPADQLRDIGDSSVSIGRLFILIFRWLLLLLVALTVEKGIDALTVKITSNQQPFFLSQNMSVSLPIIGNYHYVHWPYIVGILATLVIFMLMFRYFLCLIEPITELCRTNGNIDFHLDGWQICLNKVTRWRIALVIFASTFEFLFLIQASLALPNTAQWLTFLALLALFDLGVFILMPLLIWLIAMLALVAITLLHGASEGGVKTQETVLAVVGNRKRMWLAFITVILFLSFFVAILIMFVVDYSVSRFVLPFLLWLALIALFIVLLRERSSREERGIWLKERFNRLVLLFSDLSSEWAKLYLGWDVADISVAVIGLLLISGGYSEIIVVMSVFILTSTVSLFNVLNRRKTFKQHLSVLALVTER
jgi:hypothetical protein